jgi:hypothetical protein
VSQKRTGKIASLPYALRTQLNEKLRDGVKYNVIIAWLESNDVFGLNEQNLTNWFQGGYKDWEKDQERLANMEHLRQSAMEVVNQNQGNKLHEATIHLATSQLYEALSDFDLQSLKTLLAEKPENYAAIVNSIAKLSKGALELQKYRDACESARAEVQKLRQAGSAMDEAERSAIIDKVDEILGLKK